MFRFRSISLLFCFFIFSFSSVQSLAANNSAIPTELRIDTINLLAKIAPIEIDNGVMERPTSLAVAGWYRETANVGQPGNVVIADYFMLDSIPALFVDISSLKTGDATMVFGNDGITYQMPLTG